MINLGTRRECFFDDYLIDTTHSTTDQKIHHPVPEEILMSFDEEWEFNTSYIHIFEDNGIYKMYYIALNKDKFFLGKPGTDDRRIRCCYAESKDGLHWVKPNLGIHEFYGNKNNNIVFIEDWLDNFYVFRDDNPNCPKDRKYKGVARNGEGKLEVFFSPDGLHFSESCIITDHGFFDTLNIIFWDDNAKIYRGYIRSFHDIPMVGGSDAMDFLRAGKNVRVIPGVDTDEKEGLGGILNLGKRDIRYIESKDFVTWTDPTLLDFGESPDIPLYTNNVSIYPRAPHMYVGFPTRYNERPEWTKAFDVLCGKEERQYKMEKHAKRQGLTVTDCVFMCSRDGFHFKRYDEAFFRNGPENGTNWVYGDGFPAKGFLTTKSKFDGADDELSILNSEYTANGERLRRYRLRMDGFVSVHAGEKEAVLVTKPFTFDGNALFANMSTSACGYIYFELTDKDNNTITSCEMFGDSTDKKIGFDESLERFAGKEVVMTAKMRDADLYSIRFDKEVQ